MPDSRQRRLFRLQLALRTTGKMATRDAAALLGVEPEVARRDLAAVVAVCDDFRFTGSGRHRRAECVGRAGIAVTFGERLALHFGRQLMEFVGGTTLPNWLDELAEKLEPATGVNARRDSDRLRRRFRFVSEPYRPYEPHSDVIDEIFTALLHDRELRLEYAGGRVYARVHPYTLVVYRRALYLICRVIGRPGTVTLAVDRMQRAVRLADSFRLPASYDPDLALGTRFGIWANPAAETVRLRFAADRWDLVCARVWHPGARFEPLPDGRGDLVMHAGGQELVRLVLEWGPKCEVIEPAWLRKSVADELEAALRLYRAPEG